MPAARPAPRGVAGERTAVRRPSWEGRPISGNVPIAVVMAGGRGQRLRPLTDKVPKPLLRLGGSTIVERIIASLASAGVAEVYLAVNYKAEAFEERIGDGAALGVRVRYLHEEEALGTAGALSLLPDAPAGSVLVTNADILTRMDFGALFDAHATSGAAITIVGVEYESQVPYAVLRTEGERVVAIEEKPAQRVLCNGGIYMLRPDVLRLVPADTAIDMPDLIEKGMAEGLPVHVHAIDDKWFDIGSPEDFERVMLEFATGEEE